MKAAHIQIVELFEQASLDAATIAAELQVSEAYVQSTLMQFSKRYRAEQRMVKTESAAATTKVDFKHPYMEEAELKEFYAAYKNLALTTEDDTIKEKALRTLIDDARGRKDAEMLKLEHEKEQANKNQNINLGILNQMIEKARIQKDRLLEEKEKNEKNVIVIKSEELEIVNS